MIDVAAIPVLVIEGVEPPLLAWSWSIAPYEQARFWFAAVAPVPHDTPMHVRYTDTVTGRTVRADVDTIGYVLPGDDIIVDVYGHGPRQPDHDVKGYGFPPHIDHPDVWHDTYLRHTGNCDGDTCAGCRCPCHVRHHPNTDG
jgi:hypothetical protein